MRVVRSVLCVVFDVCCVVVWYVVCCCWLLCVVNCVLTVVNNTLFVLCVGCSAFFAEFCLCGLPIYVACGMLCRWLWYAVGCAIVSVVCDALTMWINCCLLFCYLICVLRCLF